MPTSTVYTCTKCDFQGSAFKTWGAHSYLDGDKEISIKRRMALCYGCNSITTAEVLPKDDYPNYPDYEERRKLLADRVSPAKCLQCGSHDFDFIPYIDPDQEKMKLGLPYRTGLIHRNCGGRIYADDSGPSLFMGNRLPMMYFSKEGELIRKEEKIEE
ncbi:hypothetical protein QLX67_13890 [Balneolaceae bacterium ANBcel3]|nr:hypothetical protein [Balneolaceae bacterium ANBcel3]